MTPKCRSFIKLSPLYIVLKVLNCEAGFYDNSGLKAEHVIKCITENCGEKTHMSKIIYYTEEYLLY
jgi:hypothetical protein